MADTTLKAIVDRFQAVLEASPCSLTASTLSFSHDRQPAAAIEDHYYLEDGGLVSNRPMGNYKAARMDRLRVFIAKKAKFDGVSAFETMTTLLLTIERAIKADGLSNSYHAEIESHRVTQPIGKDILIGEIALAVDYDVNEAAA